MDWLAPLLERDRARARAAPGSRIKSCVRGILFVAADDGTVSCEINREKCPAEGIDAVLGDGVTVSAVPELERARLDALVPNTLLAADAELGQINGGISHPASNKWLKFEHLSARTSSGTTVRVLLCSYNVIVADAREIPVPDNYRDALEAIEIVARRYMTATAGGGIQSRVCFASNVKALETMVTDSETFKWHQESYTTGDLARPTVWYTLDGYETPIRFTTQSNGRSWQEAHAHIRGGGGGGGGGGGRGRHHRARDNNSESNSDSDSDGGGGGGDRTASTRTRPAVVVSKPPNAVKKIVDAIRRVIQTGTPGDTPVLVPRSTRPDSWGAPEVRVAGPFGATQPASASSTARGPPGPGMLRRVGTAIATGARRVANRLMSARRGVLPPDSGSLPASDAEPDGEVIRMRGGAGEDEPSDVETETGDASVPDSTEPQRTGTPRRPTDNGAGLGRDTEADDDEKVQEATEDEEGDGDSSEEGSDGVQEEEPKSAPMPATRKRMTAAEKATRTPGQVAADRAAAVSRAQKKLA